MKQQKKGEEMLNQWDIMPTANAFANEVLNLAEERGLEENVVYAAAGIIKDEVEIEREYAECDRMFKRNYHRYREEKKARKKAKQIGGKRMQSVEDAKLYSGRMCGEDYYKPIFRRNEIERAEQIAKALEGLTIQSATILLDKMKDYLTVTVLT